MTDERLAELGRLADAATPGPWRAGRPAFRCTAPEHLSPNSYGNVVHVAGKICRFVFVGWHDDVTGTISRDPGYAPESVFTDEPPVVCGMWDYDEGGVREPHDAAFIAAARAAVPELLAEVRRLRAEPAANGGGL